MALPAPVPEPLVALIAERFKLLGEPMRVRILDLLRDGERSVGELANGLGASQQNVSRHLAILHRADVLDRRREGNRVLYSIADEGVLALCEHVCGSIERRLGELNELLEGAADRPIEVAR
jgi:DNA-binding transcriptional ArsR family regulator